MNRYAVDLEIPYTFPLKSKEQFDNIPRPPLGTRKTWHLTDLDPKELNEDFLSWLDSLGLVTLYWDIFIQPPKWEMHVHIDQHDSFEDVAKLNFAWCDGVGYSKMRWYDADESSSTIKGNAGGLYRNWDKQLAKFVYEHQILTPTLVNPGKPHNIINDTDHPRICVSIPLIKKSDVEFHTENNLKYLTWDDALEIFAPYIK